MGGSYAYDTANFIPGSKQSDKKITVNLEDAILEEQKLFQILEVRIGRKEIYTVYGMHW